MKNFSKIYKRLKKKNQNLGRDQNTSKALFFFACLLVFLNSQSCFHFNAPIAVNLIVDLIISKAEWVNS